MNVNKFIYDLFKELETCNIQVPYSVLAQKKIIEPDSENECWVIGQQYQESAIENKNTNNIDIPVLVQSFRDLFKKKRKTLYGSRATCLKNMEWFIKEYPDYADIDIILAATKMYLRTTDPRYTRQAHYFIKKKVDGTVVCDLETYCSLVVESDSVEQENTQSLFNGITAI